VIRLVGYTIGVAVIAALLSIPALFFGDGEATANYEDTSISSYVADFTVRENGDLDVTETITVDVPVYGKHGIFRFWDRVDVNDDSARRDPEDISVTRDGRDEPFELSNEDHGRFRVAKIGSADVTLDTGEHVYVIKYHIDGVITEGDDSITSEPSQFYWQLIPGGWQQSIDAATLTVHLPVESESDVQCAIGWESSTGCEAEGAGSKDLTITTGPIGPRTPLSIATGLDMDTPEAGNALPWTPRFDRVLGRSVPVLAIVLLLGLGAGVLGGIVGARSREKPPGFPLLYAPPEGIGPAQAKYIYSESIDREAYVATLMYAAEKEAIELTRENDTWTIKDRNGPNGWAGLDPVTLGTAHILGGPGTAFTANKKDVEAGKRLRDEISLFDNSVENWARSSGHLVTSGLGGMGGFLVLAGFAGVIAIAIWNPFSMTMVGLIPGAFAVCGTSLMATGSGTRRTRSGRDLWSKVGGFRRMLSTPSSKERFDFSGREELYTAYIPWAVALGCAKEWAAKYRTEMGTEPPVPHYFAGAYAGSSPAAFVDSMTSDFSATVDSAISSYNATQSSSSSGGGGGGFSGGGGGGGGGGGSW
jgi:uncharacterized membrane protein YgcG